MTTINKDPPLDDVEFLARSEHRVAALTALASRPRTREDLRELTGASPSTIGRMLRAFEERDWIRRSGHAYEATQLGAFVADGMRELLNRCETERRLRTVWRYLPDEESGFSIEMASDAVVTVADADDPYRPVNRFRSLLRETDRFRFVGFDLALLEPCTDELCRRIVDGMVAEIVDPPHVAEYIRSVHPERFADAAATGNLTLRVDDDLPSYGVGVFDDRAAVVGYDPTTRTVQVMIDTDAPDARAWATETVSRCRRGLPAVPLGSGRELAPPTP